MTEKLDSELLHFHDTHYKSALHKAMSEVWTKRIQDPSSEEESRAMSKNYSAIMNDSISVVRTLIESIYDSWQNDEIERENAEQRMRARYEDLGAEKMKIEEELYYKNLNDAEGGYWNTLGEGGNETSAERVAGDFLDGAQSVPDTTDLFTYSTWVQADKNLVYLISRAAGDDLDYLRQLRAEWIRLALANNDWLWVFQTKESYGKAMRYEIGLNA